MNILYNFSGLVMCVWYIGARWILCKTEPWIYNPINFLTAVLSCILLIPSLFMPHLCFLSQYKEIFYCIAIFILLRNVVYVIEDALDYIHNINELDKTKKILESASMQKQIIPGQILRPAYVILDIFMVVFCTLWVFKYYVG